MLKYEITEFQRREIMQALEWAEWALEVSMQTARDESAESMRLYGKPGAAADVLENLAAEKSAVGHLWDTLNALVPVDVQPDLLDPDVMAERVKQIREIVEQ